MKNHKTSLQTFFALSAALGIAGTAIASPAVDTWTGSTGANWSSPGNWTGGNAPPQGGDTLIFGSSGQTTLNNDLTAGLAIDGIYFSGGSAFTLNGNSVLLSQTNVGPTGITNASGQTQTFGMNLNLDWGYYTLFSPLGGTVALNGTTPLTANLGGVAYFDNNATSSTMTTDASGLISGLGGAGLMWNGTSPTGLATITGGTIQAYGGFASVSPGAVSSGNNIALNATGAAAAYTDSGISVNTITALQAGNSGGTATTTLTTTGTLTVGATSGIGGVYALSGGANANLLTVTGGGITAGTAGVGGTIVYGATDTTAASFAPNAMSIASSNIDNAGGKVSIVKVGDSSIAMSSANNTFSGGAYVDQGQLQAGTSWGTGPVYVASGATFFLNNSGTISTANNFVLSPGTGFAHDNASGSQGALMPGSLLLGTGQVSLTGTITVGGVPVALSAAVPSAGDRITGNGTVTYFLNGQITGSGTLDLCSVPHAGQYTLQNQSASPNNWTGGLIIETPLTTPSSARTVVVNLGGAQTFTQIPHGAGAGNVLLYSGASSGSFINGSSATFNLNGLNATINGLYGYSAGNVSANLVVENTSATAATLTVGDNNASGNYGGVTTDSAHLNMSLAKIGTGTQTFTAALNHHGTTLVNQGTMALSGACTISNSSSLAVASGAILDASGLNNGGLTIGLAQSLVGIGTVGGSTTVNGTVQPFLGTIGTLTDSGNVILNGGGAYVWDINNATGTAGSDPGWSVLSVSGQLQISSTTANPFIIDITSLTSGDVAGNAANFNAGGSGSWVIATASGGISGFTGSGQFSINTSAFSNDPTSSAQWSVSVVGNNLVLSFTSTPVITTPLVNQTNNAGSTASFTVVAGGGVTPISFNWLQGSTPLSNGGSSASGGAVTISSSGQTSTLSIANVQDADAGGITVNVTDHVGATGSSSATLTIIDPPSSPSVGQSVTTPPVSAGSVDILTASASGTQPFTYQWYLGTNAILGATSSNLLINVSSASGASYSVVISNAAGSATNTTAIGAVSVVPNQIIFEPFNYPVQVRPSSPGPTWNAFGVTNLYNQATGNGIAWVNAGSGDMNTLQNIMFDVNYVSADATFGDSYPWPGLAGIDPNNLYQDSDGQGDINLPLGTGGAVSSGTLYMSTVLELTQGGQLLGSGFTPMEYLCGFGTGANNSTNRAMGVFIKEPGNDTYSLGVFKTSGATSTLNPGVNGNWSARTLHRSQIILVVARLNFNSSPATCDLWIDPPQSSFYANEASLPTPDVANAAGTAPDVGPVNFFFSKITAFPASRFYSDIRVGTTWASVTPPSAPTLALNNVVLAPGQTIAVFASQNAGNPVDTYQWQFNNGSPLFDGPSGTGSFYSGTGTGTLVISNAGPSDVGTYTVIGSNNDPSIDRNVANGGTLTGSASATLTLAKPPLSIAYSAPDVIVSWPTNFPGFTLQKTASLSPSSWSSGSLPAPVIVGTNYTVTVTAAPGKEFFSLTK